MLRARTAARRMGRRLRRYRQAGNFSQRRLAAAIGVHVNTLTRWEIGGIDPGHRALPRIAEALGIALDELTAAGNAQTEHIAPQHADRAPRPQNWGRP